MFEDILLILTPLGLMIAGLGILWAQARGTSRGRSESAGWPEHAAAEPLEQGQFILIFGHYDQVCHPIAGQVGNLEVGRETRGGECPRTESAVPVPGDYGRPLVVGCEQRRAALPAEGPNPYQPRRCGDGYVTGFAEPAAPVDSHDGDPVRRSRGECHVR